MSNDVVRLGSCWDLGHHVSWPSIRQASQNLKWSFPWTIFHCIQAQSHARNNFNSRHFLPCEDASTISSVLSRVVYRLKWITGDTRYEPMRTRVHLKWCLCARLSVELGLDVYRIIISCDSFIYARQGISWIVKARPAWSHTGKTMSPKKRNNNQISLGSLGQGYGAQVRKRCPLLKYSIRGISLHFDCL